MARAAGAFVHVGHTAELARDTTHRKLRPLALTTPATKDLFAMGYVWPRTPLSSSLALSFEEPSPMGLLSPPFAGCPGRRIFPKRL